MERCSFVFAPPLRYGQPLIVLMADNTRPAQVYRALALQPDSTSYMLMHDDDPEVYTHLVAWVAQAFKQDSNARMLCVFQQAAEAFLANESRKTRRAAVIRHLNNNPAMVDALHELVRAYELSETHP